jgi:6-phosphogluconate dehydrogenase
MFLHAIPVICRHAYLCNIALASSQLHPIITCSVFTGTKVVGAHSIAELVSKLKRPRRVMMLVKAGSAVDDFIAQLVSIE